MQVCEVHHSEQHDKSTFEVSPVSGSDRQHHPKIAPRLPFDVGRGPHLIVTRLDYLQVHDCTHQIHSNRCRSRVHLNAVHLTLSRCTRDWTLYTVHLLVSAQDNG